MEWSELTAQERDAVWITYRLAEFIEQQHPRSHHQDDWAWFAAQIIERTDDQTLTEVELLSRATRTGDPRYYYLVSVRYGPVARLCSFVRTLRSSNDIQEHTRKCTVEAKEIVRLLKPIVDDLRKQLSTGAGV